MSNLALITDAEGIATITIDIPGRAMNVISPALTTELARVFDTVAADSAIRGVIITSSKQDFMAGADIMDLMSARDAGLSLIDAFEYSQTLSRLFRRMETSGKPIAAAINGLALGGGFEICMACHYRVLIDDRRACVGLPEVKLGLLPGAGGTQRLPRLIGIPRALPLLLDGRQIPPKEALALGLVHAVVAERELLAHARGWLRERADPVQPWDKKGFVIPGGAGIMNPDANAAFTLATAAAARDTQRNYPAVQAILTCVFNGTQLPIDLALRVESKYFARLLTGPVARNLMRTMFINKGLADKLARRPSAPARSKVRRLGILGAGMMGGGIAYAAAMSGIEVVLLDTNIELAERGRGYSAQALAKQVESGRHTRSEADDVLTRIHATENFGDLADCDLIIEAVFENVDVKASVTRKAESVIPPGAIFASNTSTLPISELASASERPDRFIGLHFFSPAERMPLVEVILGKKTSDETLAHALDFVRQLRKTPIVVNDSRGFYTSRVVACFLHEGLAMLKEGVAPALIENGARMAGMPVGPLAVSDEVTIDLLWKIICQSEKALGAAYVRPAGYDVVRRFVDEFRRLGRRHGGGFCDYPAGQRKRFWPGLAQHFPPAPVQPPVTEVQKRLLYIQALETARCLEEGVLAHPADADLGSILGWGFPTWTGGAISLIETVGLRQFVGECDRLARAHGPRFEVPEPLRARASRGELFHQRTASSLAT